MDVPTLLVATQLYVPAFPLLTVLILMVDPVPGHRQNVFTVNIIRFTPPMTSSWSVLRFLIHSIVAGGFASTSKIIDSSSGGR